MVHPAHPAQPHTGRNCFNLFQILFSVNTADTDPGQIYLVSRHIPDRTQRWRWRSCFAAQQQKCFIKFWTIKKTKVQKIYVEVEVYGLIIGRTSAQVKTMRLFSSTLSTTKVQNLSKYQVLLFRGIFQLSKLHFDDLGPGI